ncbi:MAG: hypothetical protein ACOCXL_00265 [Halanaerobium sp.]
MKDKDQEQRVAALEVNEIQKFLGTVDPVKLKRMYKAEASDNRAEYNRIKAELLREYRRLKD